MLGTTFIMGRQKIAVVNGPTMCPVTLLVKAGCKYRRVLMEEAN